MAAFHHSPPAVRRLDIVRAERERQAAQAEARRLAAETVAALHVCLSGDWQEVHSANLTMARLVRVVLQHRLDLAA